MGIFAVILRICLYPFCNMQRLLFISALLFFGTPMSAQKLYAGLLGGINFPDTYANKKYGLNDPEKENKKETAIGGIGILYQIYKFINFRSEIFYEERGWKVKSVFTLNPEDGGSDMSEINYIYPFITTPILIEGKVGRRWQIFINAGINLSLRIGGRAQTANGMIPLVFVFPEDKKPVVDFAGVCGGGLRIPIGKKVFIQPEYRYYYSWTPIGVGYSIDSVIKHKGYLLTLAAYYGLK
jgi:Outer membrane protein beta-barrel domain